ASPAVTNPAAVFTPGDLTPANDAAADPTAVGGAPDLALALRHAGAFVAGQNGTYTLVSRNLGSAATTGAISVTDSLPAGLSFVSGSGAGWSFSSAGSAVTATHAGPVAVGDSLVCSLP